MGFVGRVLRLCHWESLRAGGGGSAWGEGGGVLIGGGEARGMEGNKEGGEVTSMSLGWGGGTGKEGWGYEVGWGGRGRAGKGGDRGRRERVEGRGEAGKPYMPQKLCTFL